MSLSGHKDSPAFFAWGILCRVTRFSKTSRIDTGEPVRFFYVVYSGNCGNNDNWFFCFMVFSAVAFLDMLGISPRPDNLHS